MHLFGAFGLEIQSGTYTTQHPSGRPSALHLGLGRAPVRHAGVHHL
jgi:hypothetical protein